MNNDPKIKLFLVDDDLVYLKLLEIEFLDHADFSIQTFATGELCLENLASCPDVIILDYHLNSIDNRAMNGLAILDKIKAFNSSIPVVMLSSQDKIEVAINCMHHNAFDYVVKSETAFTRLRLIISTIMHFQRMTKELNWYMERM